MITRRNGMTIIEVVLASAILSVALVVLLTGAARCLGVMKLARNYQTARWTMDLGNQEHPMLSTNDVNDLEVAAITYPNGYKYSRTVEDDEDEDGLYIIRTRVSWSDRGREPYEEVVEYVWQKEEE
jgi:prepilin-type N-terminal cleavage/methylation domain-containing protein